MPLAFLNANNANIARQNAELKSASAGFSLLADGVGVDIASLALHGAMFPANLNGTDLVPRLLRRIERPLKVALIGARRDVAETRPRRLSGYVSAARCFGDFRRLFSGGGRAANIAPA